MADKRKVLKEFEWFQVQTKVRQIVGDILIPIEKKIMANATAISRLDHSTKQEHQKVEYITKMVHNDPEIFEHGVFSTIEAKIKASNIHIEQLQAKIVYLEEFIDSKIKVLDKQLEESSEAINGVNEFKEFMKGELDSQHDKLVKSMQNLFSNFDSINQDITALTIDLQTVKASNVQISQKIDNTIQNNNQTSIKVSSLLQEFNESLKQIKVTEDLNVRDIGLLKEQIQRVGRFQKYTKQLEEQIRNLSNQISNMEYKIEVVHPMIGLAQIYEYAHHFLPPQMHNNISIYFYNHYRDLVEEIVENQVDKKKIGENKRKTLSFLKQTHKKTTKQIFKLKKQYLQCQGIDLDSLSHDKRQQVLQNLILKEEFGQNGMFGAEITARRKKEQEESSLTVELEKEKISLMSELKQIINLEIKDSKKYILAMEELFKRQLQELEKRVMICQERCSKNQVEIDLQATAILQLDQSTKKQFALVHNNLEKLQGSLKQTHHIMTAFKEIQKQDENDRYNIALLGVREHYRDQIKEYRESIIRRKTPYELKDSCLSCSGNPNYYNQFFKMACLTYASTPITLNNRVYQRFELLDQLEKQLEEVGKLGLEKQTTALRKDSSYEKHSQKMNRYQSSQVMRLPSREVRSASDSFMIRNVSSSQEVHNKEKDVPRIIGSKELAQQLMEKNRSRLCSRQKQPGYRQFKARRESNSKERTSYMINVSGFFKDLKKQNLSFIRDEDK